MMAQDPGYSPDDLAALNALAGGNRVLADTFRAVAESHVATQQLLREILYRDGVIKPPAPQPQSRTRTARWLPDGEGGFDIVEESSAASPPRPRGKYRYAKIDRDSEPGVVHAVAVNDVSGRTKRLRIERAADGSLDVDEQED
jgi:hypothetical protein